MHWNFTGRECIQTCFNSMSILVVVQKPKKTRQNVSSYLQWVISATKFQPGPDPGPDIAIGSKLSVVRSKCWHDTAVGGRVRGKSQSEPRMCPELTNSGPAWRGHHGHDWQSLLASQAPHRPHFLSLAQYINYFFQPSPYILANKSLDILANKHNIYSPDTI